MTTEHEAKPSGSSDEHAEGNAALGRRAEQVTEEVRELWHKVSSSESIRRVREKIRKPSIGAVAAGAAVLAAGAVWGASEAAVAAIAAYAVFRMLRRRDEHEKKGSRERHDGGTRVESRHEDAATHA
jgi:hypothetical protein